jgi:hypothetical protein
MYKFGDVGLLGSRVLAVLTGISRCCHFPEDHDVLDFAISGRVVGWWPNFTEFDSTFASDVPADNISWSYSNFLRCMAVGKLQSCHVLQLSSGLWVQVTDHS